MTSQWRFLRRAPDPLPRNNSNNNNNNNNNNSDAKRPRETTDTAPYNRRTTTKKIIKEQTFLFENKKFFFIKTKKKRVLISAASARWPGFSAGSVPTGFSMRFYRVLPSFTEFYRVFTGYFPVVHLFFLKPNGLTRYELGFAYFRDLNLVSSSFT